MSNIKLVSVGVQSMDAQHKLLYSLVQDVVSCIQNDDQRNNFISLVHNFRATLAAHFISEENALTKANYNDVDAHKEKHNNILLDVSRHISALELVDSTSTRFSIINEIEDCIYNHELLDDSEYSGILSESLPDFEWNDLLSVGISWIDSQHKKLFSMVSIFRAYISREDFDTARFVFERILSHVRQHFDDEEMYIKSIGASALAHRRQHFHVLMALEDAWAKSDNIMLSNLDHFVIDWLRSHIVNDDRKDLLGIETS